MAIYPTKCGGTIRVSDKTAHHLEAHPDVATLLPSAIEKIPLPITPGQYEFEVDFGRIIGRSGVKNTSPLGIHTDALFAVRKNRTFPARVCPIGEIGEETASMMLIARPSHMAKQYDLVTSWIGSASKKEPWDPTIGSVEEFDACLTYWRSNSIIYDAKIMGSVSNNSFAKLLEGNKYLSMLSASGKL
jgi:hypothetical protein